MQSCIHDTEEGGRSDTRKRPLVGCVAAKPLVSSDIEDPCSSCLIPAHRRCADRGAAREDIDDDHRRAAMSAGEDGPDFDDGVARWRTNFGYDVQEIAYPREPDAAHRVRKQIVDGSGGIHRAAHAARSGA